MEKQIDLNKVLFHGLGHNELENRAEDSIRRLENILKTKAILSRNKQKEILTKHNIDLPLYSLPKKMEMIIFVFVKENRIRKNQKLVMHFINLLKMALV